MSILVISNCNFDDIFNYQQRGLSIVSSDPIHMCFCGSNKPNCSINNTKVAVIPGTDVKIPLATVVSKDGLTKDVIMLKSFMLPLSLVQLGFHW